MKCLVGGVGLAVIAAVTTAARAAAVQWRVEDGGNGHYYEAISAPGGISWTAANAASQTGSVNGIAGHLATITSMAENSFVFDQLANSPALWNGQGPWLGGYRDITHPLYGTNPLAGWNWVTGEAWSFANWAAGEPNQGFPVPTDHLQFFIDTVSGVGPSSFWNDTFDTNPNSSQPVLGYIVEYPVPSPASGGAVCLAAAICTGRARRACPKNEKGLAN